MTDIGAEYKNNLTKALQKKEQQKKESKEKLLKLTTTRIKTTMIGSIATIEKLLSPFWDKNPEIKNVYESMRQEILDKGNNQIRSLESDLDSYDIIIKKNELPIRKEQNG